MRWGQRREGLTEEGLQADHASDEAIKIDAELAARVPHGDGLLQLIAEREACGQRDPHHTRGGCRPHLQ